MYPVHCAFVKPARYSRLQLVIRLLASLVLGILGVSLAAFVVAAYVGLAAYAAARIASAGPEAYLREDGPKLTRALTWVAAVYAWFGLVVDQLPVRSPSETVEIGIQVQGRPTAVAALLRLLTGLPAALVLALLACLGGLVWLFSLLTVLVSERVPAAARDFMAGVQRMAVRLLAYQAALVDVYPPLSFADEPHGQVAGIA